MKAYLKRKFNAIELSRATVYGVLTMVFRFFTGPLSAMLIMAFFTPELQGYYYTFGSVLGLQVFIELGFSRVVTYFAAHNWAKLSFDKNGRVTGDSDQLSLFISLGHCVFRWYLLGGILLAVGIGSGGYLFFSQTSSGTVSWELQWILLCVLTGIIFAITPVWSLLEGCNQVAQVYFFRMCSSIILAVVTMSSIYLGAGLWTASIASSAMLIFSVFFLLYRYSGFLLSFIDKPKGPKVAWAKDLFTVQWRAAISSLGNYFSFSFFTPIIFHFHGAIPAGQLGLSMTLVNAFATIATMWTAPKGPQFAIMIAKREYVSVDKLLKKLTKINMVLLILGGLLAWLLVYALNIFEHPFSLRLVSPLPLAFMIAGIIIGNIIYPTTVYLRAHKREPYALYDTVNALLSGALALILGIKYAIMGIASSYLLMSICLFPWRLGIFLRDWKRFR